MLDSIQVTGPTIVQMPVEQYDELKTAQQALTQAQEQYEELSASASEFYTLALDFIYSSGLSGKFVEYYAPEVHPDNAWAVMQNLLLRGWDGEYE